MALTDLKIRTKDGEILETRDKLFEKAPIVREAKTFADEEGCISLNKITSNILRRIIIWAEKCDDESYGLVTGDIEKWKENFLNIDNETLFQMISAADELQQRDLVNRATDKVANEINGMSAPEIAKYFNLRSKNVHI
ncbi:PREDICTED: S-phase kinase-associated protein 1-like [Rhagoletis zephyria]|uniref:S-phase kinase-associated protein 1-like n=1 Tax=Rhagoletis zephyria TaxID=28612 RepID=UPI0008119C16|nr:PREDICTED: S-phase kinase-associated protein 1-like [Rhagoletis zephyria]XP_017494050.1 PREDICTED: S-phase kinase-associated protein 1-like [Rhagoletis zephyria]XP_036318618.1 S-phase kinase-associated protein 1-like [Rhagoletis pomonella]